MKCIRCNTDNNLRDRRANQGRCKSCQHPFAFDPQTMGAIRFTDGLFAKTLTQLSANNTLFFTQQQLLYALERKLNRTVPMSPLGRVGCLGLGIGFLLCFVVPPIGVPLLLSAIGLSIIEGILAKRRKPKPVPVLLLSNQVRDWLDRWQSVNGRLDYLLPNPQQSLQAASAAAVSPEVTQYSFDRVVVCERDTLAQVLIANQFHFENNCAVLSLDGYPQPIFQTTLDMLRRNPDLQIYALHDCTPDGMSMIPRLRTDPAWFADFAGPIIEVGIRPQQVMDSKVGGLRGFVVRVAPAFAQAANALPPEIRATLSEAELQWLQTGQFVAVNSLPPHRLIQVLQRTIAKRNTLSNADGGIDGGSDFLIIGDSGGGVFAAESFG